jgi:hypothetical protein
VVVVSGDASAAFCDRVAGMVVVVVVERRSRVLWWLVRERERVVSWMDSLKGMGEFVVTREGARAPIVFIVPANNNKRLGRALFSSCSTRMWRAANCWS